MMTASSHGTQRDGTPITNTAVEALADEAEQGYDVDTLLSGGSPADLQGASPPRRSRRCG